MKKIIKLFELSKIDMKNLLIIQAIFIVSTAILYGYYFFFTNTKLQLIYQNWDGPSYVVIAKSFYDAEIIPSVNTLKLPTTYFAAHFPLYPMMIRFFSLVGFYQSMILSALISTMLFLTTFYLLVKKYSTNQTAFWLALTSIFISPRWFIVSHVGSSEPLFLFLLCLTLLLIKNKKHGIAAIAATLMQLTRIQGILFFGGISIYYLYLFIFKKKSFKLVIKEYVPYLLMPISILLIFFIYKIQLGNFFAFFEAQKLANVQSHLQFPPFKVLTLHYPPFFSLDSWKEIYIGYYLLISITVASLFKKKYYLLGFTSLIYSIPLFFLVHTDLARYSIPLIPFFLLTIKDKLSPKLLFITTLFVIPAIYVFAISYININLTP